MSSELVQNLGEARSVSDACVVERMQRSLHPNAANLIRDVVRERVIREIGAYRETARPRDDDLVVMRLNLRNEPPESLGFQSIAFGFERPQSECEPADSSRPIPEGLLAGYVPVVGSLYQKTSLRHPVLVVIAPGMLAAGDTVLSLRQIPPIESTARRIVVMSDHLKMGSGLENDESVKVNDLPTSACLRVAWPEVIYMPVEVPKTSNVQQIQRQVAGIHQAVFVCYYECE